ncbi:MAG: acyltransferase family protein [Spirochaetia bacterium]
MQVTSVPSASVGATPRMAWIDNIRWTVIAMVVLVHACVTYSGLGSWYYKEPGVLGIGAKLVFTAYTTFSQAFFMGLLFFVAALFVPASYDRKGFAKFVGERAFRLGVPSLVFMLILDPLTSLIRAWGTGQFDSWAGAMERYSHFVTSGSFLNASGPLWFAVALLAFSLVYALARLLGGARAPEPRRAPHAEVPRAPRAVHVTIAGLMAVIAAGSFFIRLVQPMGTSWHNMQLCFFPSYIVLFFAGLWAGRRGFLVKLPREAGTMWLKLAFMIGLPAWFLLLGLGGALTGRAQMYFGGMYWQAAGYAAWEAFFCVSVSVGLLALYRERANVRNKGTGLLAETSFGIYTFHAPILVGVSMILRAVVIYPLAKAALAAAAAFAVSLGLAWVVRKVPGLGRVFA